MTTQPAAPNAPAVPGLLGRLVRWNAEPCEPRPLLLTGRVYRVATSYGVEIAYLADVASEHGPCPESLAVVQVARLEVVS